MGDVAHGNKSGDLYRQDFHLGLRHDDRVVGYVHIQATQLDNVLEILLQQNSPNAVECSAPSDEFTDGTLERTAQAFKTLQQMCMQFAGNILAPPMSLAAGVRQKRRENQIRSRPQRQRVRHQRLGSGSQTHPGQRDLRVINGNDLLERQRRRHRGLTH